MDTAGKAESVTDRWMSIIAAATRLRESRVRVQTRMLKGELAFQVAANRTVVLRDDVERIAEEKGL